MNGFATTTVSIYRGDTVTDDGDVIDSTTTVATNVLATITEVSQDNRTESSDSPRTARKYIVGLPYRQDVRVGDRILDEVSQATYTVDYVNTPLVLPYNSDKRVRVSRTD